MIRATCIAVSLLAAAAGIAGAQTREPLRLLQTVPLADVHGRIDHFDVDLKGRRLFMSALGNNTLEVFDLRSDRVMHTIQGLREPQGVTYVEKSNRIFVANGDDGTCRMFDGGSYRLLKTVKLSSDADDTRYDSASNQVFVGYGDGANSGLAILDGRSGELMGTIPLPGHPESFQLEARGRRIFVNIPEAHNIVAVVDRSVRRIVATWSLEGAQDNFPMALDDAHGRVFIITRTPAQMLVLDSASGRIVAQTPVVTHADDAWYDALNRRAYVSGGGGFLTVVEQRSADQYARIAQLKTAAGARTSLLLPELNRLYLGVWGQGSQSDELRIYGVQP